MAPPPPESGNLRFATLLAAVFAFVCLAGGHAGPRPAAAQASAAPPDPAPLVEALRNSGQTDPEKALAADRLLDLLETSAKHDVLARLERLLRSPGSGEGNETGPRRILLEAIARRSVVHEDLFPIVAALAEADGGPEIVGVLPALGSFRTRVSARLLLSYTSENHPQAVRQAAFAALARLSGLDDVGADRERWLGWFGRVEPLTESQWRRHLIENLARSRDQLRREQGRDRESLITAYRRIFVLTPDPAARSAMLGQLLLDERAAVRNLGFDLVAREFAQGATLNGEVAQAAIALLAHPSAPVREQAAGLIDRLAPPQAGLEVQQALRRESDPLAAAALLRASARWPSPDSVPVVVGWLERPRTTPGDAVQTRARNAAAQAARALYTAGYLEDSGVRERVLGVLRAVPDSELTGSMVRLLGWTGTETDRERVARLFAEDDAASRRAAAESLAERAEYLDLIAEAARRHEEFCGLLIDSIIAHRPTAGGFALARSVLTSHGQGAGPANGDDLLMKVAAALPPGEIVGAAGAAGIPPALRERMLARLVVPHQNGDRAGPPDAPPEGLVLLAETRLDLGRPEAALDALDRLAQINPDHPRAAKLRIIALICAERFEEAEALGAVPDAMLDALELAITVPLDAKEPIHQYVRAILGESAQGPIRARLNALERRLTPEEAEQDAGDDDPPR